MKLLFKLSLTITSLLLILVVVYLSLPLLIQHYFRYQLTQQGFNHIEFEIDSVDFQAVSLARLKMSNDGISLDLRRLRAGFTFAELLSGSVETVEIEYVEIINRAGKEAKYSLPDPASLMGWVMTPWYGMVPVRWLSVETLIVKNEQGATMVGASGELRRQAQQLIGEFNIRDGRDRHALLALNISQAGIDLRLRAMGDAMENMFSLELRGIKERGGLTGTVEVDMAPLLVLSEQAPVLSGKINAELSYFTLPNTDQSGFNVSADMGAIEVAGWKLLESSVKLEGEMRLGDEGAELTFSDSSELRIRSIKQGDIGAENLRITMPSSLRLLPESLSISSLSDATVSMKNLQMDDIRVEQAHIENIKLHTREKGEGKRQCDFTLQLSVPQIVLSETRVELSTVHVEGICPDREQLRWAIKARLENARYQDEHYQFSLLDCQLALGNTDRDALLGDSPAELGGSAICALDGLGGNINTQLRFNTTTGTGSADYSLSMLQPDEQNPLFASVYKDWQVPFEIVSGSFSADGRVRWWQTRGGKSRQNMSLNIIARDAGGHYDAILFSGLDYAGQFELLPGTRSLNLSELSVQDIDMGVPVTVVMAQLKLGESTLGTLPTLNVNSLSMSVFGGNISGRDLQFDMNSDQYSFPLRLKGLDLGALVGLQQLDGLSASGRLDGLLPVTLTKKGVRIEQGRVVAQAPGGRIQYTPEAGLSSSKASSSATGSELLLKILEDLKYDSMEVGVDYEDNGELEMKLAIKGFSPQVDAQRPVHFNMNLQQNVLTLLKGLRYVDGISEDIDNSVQKYYREQGGLGGRK